MDAVKTGVFLFTHFVFHWRNWKAWFVFLWVHVTAVTGDLLEEPGRIHQRTRCFHSCLIPPALVQRKPVSSVLHLLCLLNPSLKSRPEWQPASISSFSSSLLSRHHHRWWHDNRKLSKSGEAATERSLIWSRISMLLHFPCCYSTETHHIHTWKKKKGKCSPFGMAGQQYVTADCLTRCRRQR